MRAVKSPRNQKNVTGQNIHRIRMAAKPKITQDDMAGRLARHGLQLSQPQIAKIESGQRPLRDFEVAAFARALKVPVQTLFDGA
jgi:HTH-type transcriptional regulator, cell division transcriptional repressor